MFHWFGTVTNTRGDSLPDWQVECVNSTDGETVIPIFSDENSTPIETVSGVANRAVSDVEGNYDFFVPSGTYSLRFYDANGDYKKTTRFLPMYGADFAEAGLIDHLHSSPSYYDIAADGSASDAARWVTLTGEARAAGKLTISLDPDKDYTLTNGYLWWGIDTLEIEGNGASLRNNRSTLFGSGGMDPSSAFYASHNAIRGESHFDEIGLRAADVNNYTRNYGPLVENVSKGATTITLKAGSSTSDFTVGSRALLYGYGKEANGFPRSTRYFEWVRITDITGLVITVEQAVQSDYLAAFPDVGADAEAYQGPPRLLSLDRANFREQNLTVRNIHIRKDTGWIPANSDEEEANGGVVIGGFKQALLENFRCDGFLFIASGEHFRAKNLEVGKALEFDKFVGTIEIDGLKADSMAQGTGVHYLHVKNFEVGELRNICANRVLHLEKGRITAPQNGIVFTNSIACGELIIEDVEIADWTGVTALVNGSVWTGTFTRVSDTQLSMTLADFVSTQLYNSDLTGLVLADVNGDPVFRCSGPATESGGNALIDGELVKAGWTTGALYWPVFSRSVTLRNVGNTRPAGIMVISSNYANTPMLTRVRGEGFYEGLRIITQRDCPQPTNTIQRFDVCAGKMNVTRATITVHRAYTGATGTALLRFRDAASYGTLFDIDLKTVGTRVVDVAGNSAALGSDAIYGVTDIGRLDILTTGAVAYASGNEEAIWTLRLEGTSAVESLMAK